jgi:hypothetical protein
MLLKYHQIAINKPPLYRSSHNDSRYPDHTAEYKQEYFKASNLMARAKMGNPGCGACLKTQVLSSSSSTGGSRTY